MQPLHNLILALAFAASPASVELPTERVDLIERNAYYDQDGKLLLTQALFFEWCDREARYQVLAWRLIKTPANEPRPCRDGGYEMIWSEGGKLLRVTAPAMRESFTQFDPEIAEQKHLPKDQRKGIFRKGKRDEPLPMEAE